VYDQKRIAEMSATAKEQVQKNLARKKIRNKKWRDDINVEIDRKKPARANFADLAIHQSNLCLKRLCSPLFDLGGFVAPSKAFSRLCCKRPERSRPK
jgi:hypothetical protein